MIYELYRLKIKNSGLFEYIIVNTEADKMWCMNDYAEFDKFKQALNYTDLLQSLIKLKILLSWFRRNSYEPK